MYTGELGATGIVDRIVDVIGEGAVKVHVFLGVRRLGGLMDDEKEEEGDCQPEPLRREDGQAADYPHGNASVLLIVCPDVSARARDRLKRGLEEQ